MKNYAAIVSDFDGTLVGPGRLPTLPVITAVTSWQAKGKHFSIATGNQLAHIQPALNLLHLKAPQILRGGTELYDPLTQKIVWTSYIPFPMVKTILAFLKEKKLAFHAEFGDTVYTYDGKPMWYPSVTYAHIDTLPQIAIPKIVILQKDPSRQFLQSQDIETFVKSELLPTCNDVVTIVQSITPHSISWDITAKTASKRHAVLALAELLHITPAQIIGIGDSPNDIPLLEVCGYKVAMGNTKSDKLKALADFIAPSYEEDGMTQIIAKFSS